ncbi:hypothetical protein LK533_05965 [Sphingomonas sp. PL-96]|uniref:hypothetical protein n=1 Tax=Sphingomonas sp. PL-96 TaxID=2887201 RepID=UPI001E495890|nr:hypothetical protein [Sphingomonas sp. PL-96]MCC2976218.1 hypothetical protein [Sphingomonas sp. PL-96]
MNAPSITRLDHRLSRAAETGRGIRLEPADLDLLASLGLFRLTHEAKTKYIEEQTRCRDARRRSIAAGNIGSTSSAARTVPNVRLVGMSSGTTPKRDARQAHQRALTTPIKRS